jgi:hypothetical protein
MITYTTFSEATGYNDSRYGFILGVEESGVPKLDAYVDSQGIPTIGVGFNLTYRNPGQSNFCALQISRKLARSHRKPGADHGFPVSPSLTD